MYRISIYSEDRARNTSDNNTKGKELGFAVDRTSPWIQIPGLEEGAQYRERSHRALVDVQDNLCLQRVQIVLNGEKRVYEAGELAELEGKLPLLAKSSPHWQELEVTAWDGAGNVRKTEALRFLVTPNILVPFFLNKPLFYGSLGGLIVLGAALAAGFWKQRS